ncbi:hypothetical protein LLG95_16030 [bacterium]|nr:hypothetical protein [bacterium]
MEDPELNRSLDETRELHTRWGQFRDFVLMAVKSRKVTAQAEMKFLELKSRIAMLHDGFMSRLQHEQKTGQNIMSIVADCIMLKRCAGYTDAEKQKFEFDWNECYLLLTEQLGALEEEQKRLAGINIRTYNAQKRREMLAAQMYNFLHSTGLKVSLGILAAIIVLWVIPFFNIYDYKNFGKMGWSRKPYQAFVNFVWRPYVNMDLMYVDPSEVRTAKRDDAGDAKVGINRDQTMQAKLTQEYFKTKQVAAWGIRDKNDVKAIGNAAGNAWRFDTEAFTAGGVPANFYFLYFQRIEDAITFTNSVINAVNKLPADRRDKVFGETEMLRRANIVSIGVSGHAHRGWARDKYYFLPTDKDLLAPGATAEATK